MTKQTKVFSRTLALVLTVLMLVVAGIFVITAGAEETGTKSGTWGGIDWTLTTDGTLTIAPTKGTPVPDKNAPTKRTYEVGEWREAVKYNNKGVGVDVGDWPYDRAKVKTLIIEEGVTSIGSFTAQFYTNLTGEVVIPSTVTYIGQEAFQGSTMTKLTFAKVPEGQEAKELRVAHGAFKNLIIEEVALPDDRPVTLHCWAFLMCTNLKTITIPDTIGDLHGCDEIDYESSMSVNANASWTGTSQIVGGYNNKGEASNPDMETIIFGSQEAREKFYGYSDNKLGNAGAVAKVVSGQMASSEESNGIIIDCASLEIAVSKAQPGDTITLLKDTDEEVELPAGVILNTNGFSAPNATIAKPSVAQIGTQGYATLQEAINAATAGQTITFLADITEDVTVSKKVTIDGANHKYSGTMTLSKGYDVAIKNCNFDGENGKYPYAISSKGANSLTVTDCNVTNYLYGLLYVSSGMSAVSINKVTVENCPSYAVYFGTGVNNATFTNLTVKNSNNGILLNNTAVRSLTINGCKMENVSTAINYSKGTYTITVKVLGNENDFGTATIGQYVKCVLTEKTATLTAPEGLLDVIDTNVEDYEVAYKNGMYSVVEESQRGTWGGIDWELTADGTLIIKPTRGTPVADPDCGRTYEVGEWPEGVKYHSSGDYATAYYTPYDKNLVKALVIEEGVTTIGSFAVKCPNLTGEVVIPASVVYVGQSAFQNAPITKLTFAEGGTEELCIAVGAFEGLKITELQLPERSVHLHAWAFQRCGELVSAVLPNVTIEAGSKHVKYWYYGEEHASGNSGTWDSNAFAHNPKMDTLVFGTEIGLNQFVSVPNSLTTYVAYNGLTVYFNTTLQNVIDAATAGQTITFLADITGDVTINKSITIDGANHKYSGTMTLGAVTATIQNVNFVNGEIVKTEKPISGTFEILNCTFTGETTSGYAIKIGYASSLKIEGCTSTGNSFLYVPYSLANLYVKGVNVENASWAFHLVSIEAPVFENVTITDSYCGIVVQNTGNKVVTLDGCTITATKPLVIWEKQTNNVTFQFKNNNNFGTLAPVWAIVNNNYVSESGSNYDVLKLALDATLKAAAGLTIDTVEGYKVVYREGVYAPIYDINVEKTNMRFGNSLSLLFAVNKHTCINDGYYALVNGTTIEFANWSTTLIGEIEYYVVEFAGLVAKQMTDKVTIQIYDANGNVFDTFTTSIREYAMNRLEASGSEAFKTLVVDMLIYGAIAQEQFGYNTDDLADQYLTDGHLEFASEAEDYKDSREVTGDGKEHFVASTLRFNERINVLFKVNAKIKEVTYSYKNHNGVKVSGSITNVQTDGENYYVELDKLVVADAYKKQLSVKIYFVDGTSVTISDNAASYAARAKAQAQPDADLAVAFAKFAKSSYTYLHTPNVQ